MTLDQVYEVQHTALDSDVQASMARILNQCANDPTDLTRKAAKVVALLELIQDVLPTDAKLVAQCLYDRVDRGNRLNEITEALENLRRREPARRTPRSRGTRSSRRRAKNGSASGRKSASLARRSATLVQDSLKFLIGVPGPPAAEGPRHSPGLRCSRTAAASRTPLIADPRDEATVRVDFRFLIADDRTESAWVQEAAESALHDRIVWVCGDTDQVEQQPASSTDRARWGRNTARAGSPRCPPSSSSCSSRRRIAPKTSQASFAIRSRRPGWPVGSTSAAEQIAPQDYGDSFAKAVLAAANRVAARSVSPLRADHDRPARSSSSSSSMTSPAPRRSSSRASLGILELDSGRYVASCGGLIPRQVLEHVESEGGIGGTAILATFRRPAVRLPAERAEGLRRRPASRREAPHPARGRGRDHRDPRRRASATSSRRTATFKRAPIFPRRRGRRRRPRPGIASASSSSVS